MRILYSWLSEFMNRLPEAAELARMLTERGVEAELLIPLQPAVTGLVVGRVTGQPTSDDEQLAYSADVNGEAKTFTSRAADIPVGYEVFLNTGDGSIPTLEELGLAPVRFPLVKPEAMSIEDIAADCVIDFAPVSNRGDLLSHLGIAREAALAVGQELRMPALADIDPKAKGDNRPTIELPAPDLCPRYVGCYFDSVKIEPGPDWMAYRLSLCGVNPISNIVDLSNYLLFELGQPMHTFDRDILSGTISARRASPGERFTAINHVEYELTRSHLVIADEKKAVALAGVMGGVESEIRDTTASVLLESAYFTPKNNRITSRRLGLQSESSLRFGRGIDPQLPPVAARRFIHLAESIGAASFVRGSFVDANVYKQDTEPIPFDCARINSLLGASINTNRMVDALVKLGMTIKRNGEHFTAVPPSWRHDIEMWEDLAEEVMRLNLFDSLEPRTLRVPLKSGVLEPVLSFARRTEDLLTRLGGQQVMNQAFLSPQRAEAFFGENHHLVPVQNPDSADQAFLIGSLLPGMLASAEHNRRHSERPPFCFELARIYSLREFETGVSYTLDIDGKGHYEQQALGLIYGDGFTPPAHLRPDFSGESPLFVLKGVLSELFAEIGGPEPEFSEARQTAMAAGRTFAISAGGTQLGILGEITASVLEAGEERLAFAQMNLDRLATLSQRHLRLAGYSVYPRVERDLAMLVPATMEIADSLDIIREAGGDLLVDAFPFDIYRGKQIPPDHKSVAFHLVFQSPERTLTGTEVDERVLAALVELHRRKNIVIRDFSRIKELSIFSDERFSDELHKAYGV